MPEKIAVLGGGISSLSTVIDLTAEPNWQQKYDITVYQMGWRLGGKGASSRNPNIGQRIEEHGLHIWLGFYENAFELIRQCYSELPSNSGTFNSWQDAFKPHNLIVLEEKTSKGWLHWAADIPANDSLPGDGKLLPTMWDYVLMIFETLGDELQQLHQHIPAKGKVVVSSWSAAVMKDELKATEQKSLPLSSQLLRAGHRRARKLRRHEQPSRHKEVTSILDDFQRTVDSSVDPELLTDANVRRPYIFINIFSAVVRGLMADGVIASGLDALDDFELRAWLRRHGASEISLNSAGMRAAYDLAFSFEDGDPEKPNLAAGTGLRSMLRLLLTYKGGLLWKMQAGMGETVFTPIYKVLKKRGVKFRFFHKVEEISLSPDQSRVETIRITKQATPRSDEYAPLCRVKQWDCWRQEPDYAQLVEGEALKASGANLESTWSTWPATGTLELKAGIDFDKIVLGIPIAALKTICKELAEARPEWQAMLDHVKTTQTQGFQVWLSKDLAECGWKLASPVLGSYVEPLDTWADMSHLLPAEDWPTHGAPKQLAYFCGVMKDAAVIPPPSDAAFPEAERSRTLKQALDYLEEYVSYLWPDACQDEKFDWNLCVDSQGRTGRERFQAQYWRPNIDPSERYTLAVAGSTKYRLRADQSGLANLILTGDWVRNGFNSPGCIESSVISGRQAARAISGIQRPILGESDFSPQTSLLRKIFVWVADLWERLISSI